MKALVIAVPGSSPSVQDVPDPTPGPHDVIVAPRAAGICGTDLHILAGDFPPAPYPLVPGHEFAGEVVAVVFGVAPQEARLPVSQYRIYNDEITVLGSMAVLNSFEPALALMASGAIAAEPMVTHRFELASFDDAITAVRERRGLKVQITT